ELAVLHGAVGIAIDLAVVEDVDVAADLGGDRQVRIEDQDADAGGLAAGDGPGRHRHRVRAENPAEGSLAVVLDDDLDVAGLVREVAVQRRNVDGHRVRDAVVVEAVGGGVRRRGSLRGGGGGIRVDGGGQGRGVGGRLHLALVVEQEAAVDADGD